MAADIILKENEISITGLKVSVQNKMEIEKSIKIGITPKRTYINSGLIMTSTINAKKMTSKTAVIGVLDISSTVANKSVPGKITIGNTTLTEEEIRCKKVSAPFFVGISADVHSLKVKGEVIGSLKVSGEITARKITELSDVRCKQDINVLSNSLNKIISLQGVSYNWKENELTGRNPSKEKQIGFVAQDVEKILPEAVTQDAEGRRSLAYSSIIPLLVESIKEQQKEIKQQRLKIHSQTTENMSLVDKINHLEITLNAFIEKMATKGNS